MAGYVPADVNRAPAAPSLNDLERMRVNGETQAILEHARSVKNNRPDTSVDDVWKPDRTLCCVDLYIKVTSLLYLGAKAVFMLPFIFLGFLVPMFLARRYGASLKPGTRRVNRKTCAFFCFRLTMTLTMAPAGLVWIFSWLADGVFYYAFSVPYALLTCHWCCFSRFRASLEVLKPYQGGPGFIYDDFLVCLIGQTRRQRGCWEMALGTSTMIIFVPWLKYYYNANPWLVRLEERFVQQISTSMADLGEKNAVDALRTTISDAAQEDAETADRLDHWKFVPHYPHPPPGRRYAMGMQHINQMSFMTHSLHADAAPELSGESADVYKRDLYVLSNSCERLVWRVPLYYNNRYHFCTGWVEASISNGEQSQRDKRGGAEHPMWLVSSRLPSLAKRTAFIGYSPSFVDAFFDNWLVVLVDEVRAIVRGVDIAKQLHQKVVSKDGVSRPSARIGFDALSEQAPSYNPTLGR